MSGGEVGVREDRVLGVLMTNSAYVARVGGLAVALGIGAAMATGHEAAWAETPDGSSEAGGTSTSSVSALRNQVPRRVDQLGDPTAPLRPRQTRRRRRVRTRRRRRVAVRVTPGKTRRRSRRWISVTAWSSRVRVARTPARPAQPRPLQRPRRQRRPHRPSNRHIPRVGCRPKKFVEIRQARAEDGRIGGRLPRARRPPSRRNRPRRWILCMRCRPRRWRWVLSPSR